MANKIKKGIIQENLYDMDDNEMNDIFKNFNPNLGIDSDFIQKIENRLNDIELVKTQIKQDVRLNKKIAAIAAFAGFLSGVATTLIMPFIVKLFTNHNPALPYSYLPDMDYFLKMAICFSVALVTVLVTIKVYSNLSTNNS